MAPEDALSRRLGQGLAQADAVNFSGMIMPEKDTEKRFTEWPAATADFVAMMAMAARH